jgi:putative inorganic carbon (hco3(-)) transporter
MMAVGLGVALRSRFGALLVYLWFALFRPQEWVWVDISSLRLSLVVGLLFVVPSVLSGSLPNLSHPLSLGSLAFLGTALVAQFGAIRPDIGWYWLNFLATLILVCLLLVTLVGTKRKFVLTVAVIAASFGIYPAKGGLASLAGGGVQFFAGLGGAFGDNNGYALGTVMIMPFLVAAGQNLSPAHGIERWIRRAFFLSVPLAAFTVVSLFSRGAAVAMAASALVYVLLQERRLVYVLGLAAFLTAAIAALPFQARYLERLQTIGSYEEIQDNSALGRLHFWQVAIDMVRENPLGVGLFNFQPAYDHYDSSGGAYGTERSVHSSHFQVLAETGFAGAALWCVMFVVAIWKSLRVRNRARQLPEQSEDRHFLFTMANALLVSMVGFLVGGAFLALALNDLTWLTFALVAALDRLSARMVVEGPVVAAGV